ncbi:AraC family transcriptional regulator [Paenibacillus polymyxa]|uniref:helix-turn-helix domain-containing protein n=1 Tax=Paenibacillus polymyxa TaxID=1406 RepID=UPI0025B6E60A|nr:AraC family transcriptional regulator [Paenibacillus polymyxa]MDN4078871.1 AraC family transcriptional regulator [Paenibacillus polymyxa]MDN4104290.1 AraC family transcriptional regulator [Paenibacillus polymyxa]
MNLEQLATVIPLLEHIEYGNTSQTLHPGSDSHLLIVALHGHVTLSAQDQEPVIFTQGFAFHNQYGACSIQVPKTREGEYIVLTYRVLQGESTDWTLHGPLRTLSEYKIKYMLDELLRTTAPSIQDEAGVEKAARQFRKRLLLERLLFIYIYETHMVQDNHNSSVSIEQSLSYIHEHYMLKLTLPLLADRAGMSEGHYTVLFKKATGMTMTQYLRHLRIQKAKQMFQQTRLPAKEVAQRVGFTDYFHFSRIFKKEVGCSPTQFQRI